MEDSQGKSMHEAKKESVAGDNLPNSHNMEPLDIRPSHKSMYLILAILFALIAIGFGIGLFIQTRDTQTVEPTNLTTQQADEITQEVTPLEAVATRLRNIQIDGVSVLSETSESYVMLLDQDNNILLPKNTNITIRLTSDDLSLADNLSVLAPTIDSIFTESGFQRSPQSAATLAEAAVAKYQLEDDSCIVDLDSMSSIECYTGPPDVDTALYVSLYESLTGPDFETNGEYIIGINMEGSQVQTIENYQAIRGGLGSYRQVNGVYVNIPSGGAIGFYKLQDSVEWNSFLLGQSMLACTDYNTEALQTVYAEDQCYSSNNNEATFVTVQEYYAL